MTKVTVEEIQNRLNQGKNVQFVDSRAQQVWEEAETKLPGAIRVPPDEPETKISNIRKDAYVVTYCT